MEPVQVYVLRTKSHDVSSNKDDEGWKLVTRKKKAISWRAHERATKIPDGKQGAMKQVNKSLKEDVSHGDHRPRLTSLFEFFPKGYFGKVNKIESSFMVTSHQEMVTGEISAQEKTDLVVHMVKGLRTWLNLSEAIQLVEED
ncbi:hypothetical protein ACH5RR_003348 [Cinchona calisaya]|uniref:Uncharacterized protein n=1 Tax=Cinchona calisaya TaxID=153742 RepID=A0ABD3AUJ4_9GENT